jgi:hypothetical protein
MSPVFVVWFTITLVSLVAVAAVLIGLVRHVLGLGRTLRRFQRDVTPLAEEISAQGDRAASRASRLSPPTGRGRRTGPIPGPR